MADWRVVGTREVPGVYRRSALLYKGTSRWQVFKAAVAGIRNGMEIVISRGGKVVADKRVARLSPKRDRINP